MATIDKVVLRIEADLKDVNQKLRSMEKNVKTSTEKSAKAFRNFSNIAKLAIGSVLVTQLGRLGASVIRASSAVEEMEGKFNVVFGSLAGDVKQQLDSFGNSVGRSTHELQEMASSVQDTFVPLGFSRKTASDLSVTLTKLAVDTGSFNNTLAPDVMRAFQSALVGNHETVRRFGIIIDEAAIKQELLNMGIEGGTKSATAAQKVQARLNLITAGLGDAIGDAERTAGSFANTSQRLSAEISELAVALGSKLMSPLAGVLGVMADMVEATKNFLMQIGLIEATNADQKMLILASNIADMKHQMKTAKEQAKELGALQSTAKNNATELGKANAKANAFEIKARMRDVELLKEKIALKEKELELTAEKSATFKKFGLTTPTTDSGTSTTTGETIENEGIKKLNASIEETKQKIKLYNDALQLMDDKNLQVNLSMMSFSEAVKIAGEEGLNLETILKSQTIELERVKEKYQEAQRATEEFKKEQKRLEEAINKTFIGVVESLANTFEDSLISALDGSKSALEGFKDFSRQLVQEILKTYLRLSVINPILNSIFGGSGFQARPTMGGGDIASRFIDIGRRAFGGAASGGTIQGRRPVMVGERGPEMFIPNTGGRIVPNGALGGSLTGGSPTVVNQSLNFATGVQETVRAEIFNMLPAIQKATLNAVVDQKRRGGAFAQGMT